MMMMPKDDDVSLYQEMINAERGYRCQECESVVAYEKCGFVKPSAKCEKVTVIPRAHSLLKNHNRPKIY